MEVHYADAEPFVSSFQPKFLDIGNLNSQLFEKCTKLGHQCAQPHRLFSEWVLQFCIECMYQALSEIR